MAEVPPNSPVDSIADQARSATDRIADKATDAITAVRTSIHDKVNSVADRANTATQWTSDKIDAVKQAPIDSIAAGAAYIKARPYTAVAVAFAAGYVFGRVGRPR